VKLSNFVAGVQGGFAADRPDRPDIGTTATGSPISSGTVTFPAGLAMMEPRRIARSRLAGPRPIRKR
jgi:hypothetical protein